MLKTLEHLQFLNYTVVGILSLSKALGHQETFVHLLDGVLCAGVAVSAQVHCCETALSEFLFKNVLVDFLFIFILLVFGQL